MGAHTPIYSSVQGPAKWAAVVVLSAACGAGLTYSLMRDSRPVVEPRRETTVSFSPAASFAPQRPAPAPMPAQAPVPVTPPAQPQTVTEPSPAPPTVVATESVAQPATAEPVPAPAAEVAPPLPAPPPAPSAPPPAIVNGKVNINRATAAELELLPHIGPAMAKRIVEHRTLHGPFRSLMDLDRVRGIGPKTLEKLAPLITFE